MTLRRSDFRINDPGNSFRVDSGLLRRSGAMAGDSWANRILSATRRNIFGGNEKGVGSLRLSNQAACRVSSGNKTATSGDYFAQVPNNSPAAVTILPFDLTSYTLQATVNGLGDGGILARTNATDTQYVLLVLGGEGYGQGVRGGNAGNSIYWADSNNPSATLNLVTGVFTPGNTYTIKVTAVGDTYSAFINGALTTTITDTVGGSDGGVGLYDDQPNTTTGSGFGTPTTFSNFSLQGTTVPEPSTIGLLATGFVLSMVTRRGQKRA